MSVSPHPTKGPGFWRIRYQPEGRKGGDKYLTVQGTKDEALSIEAELRRQNRQHRVSAFPTLAQAAPDYLAAYAAEHQESGTERTRRSVKILLGFFGKYLFTSITPDLVSRYKQERLKSVTHSTINKELAALSGFCKWAAEMRYCQPISIKRFPLKLTRAPYPDVPSRIEILAIINSMPWPKCGLFACMYLAGLRSAEARHLRAEDVHLDRRLLYVVGKGNKQGVVPIVRALYPILEKRLAEVPEGYLWTSRKGTPYKNDLRMALKYACKQAGVTRHVNPHLFRHAYGLHSIEARIPIKHLQQAMRHSNTTTTEMYSHLHARELVAEFERFPDGTGPSHNRRDENFE